MQKITPCLWFNNNAKEAMLHYSVIFKDFKITGESYYTEGMPQPAGTLLTAAVVMMGQEFTFLNGGPTFQFTPAISFVINCENQEEVDYYWDNLSKEGREDQCGWLQDKFGVSWQIVPVILPKLFSDPDAAKVQKAAMAMFRMKKINIAMLEAAFNS